MQERIAASIADALSVSFDVGADSTAYGGTDNPEAYAALLEADAFEKLVTDLGLVKMWRQSGDWGDYCRPVSATEISCH